MLLVMSVIVGSLKCILKLNVRYWQVRDNCHNPIPLLHQKLDRDMLVSEL